METTSTTVGRRTPETKAKSKAKAKANPKSKPKVASPEDVTPEDVTPEDVTPEDVIPAKPAPDAQRIAPVISGRIKIRGEGAGGCSLLTQHQLDEFVEKQNEKEKRRSALKAKIAELEKQLSEI